MRETPKSVWAKKIWGKPVEAQTKWENCEIVNEWENFHNQKREQLVKIPNLKIGGKTGKL